jgi:hypothetical protein
MSCTNSTRTAHPVHHRIHRRPLAAGLEQHGEVAPIGRGGREAQLAAGPAGEGLHRGVGQQDPLEDADLAVGLGQRGPGRRPVVQDEAALVHLRQEAGADHPREAQPEREQHRARAHRDAPVAEHPADRPGVALFQRPERHPRQPAPLGVGPALGARRPLRHHCRDQRHRQHQREQHRHRQRDRERAEELAHHAREQPERREHHDRGERRARHRPEDLVGAGPHDVRRRLVWMQCQPPLDVLDHDDRVVDDDADGHGEAAQAHEIERVAREGQAEQRDRDREREAQRGRGRRAPLAQEQEQYQDRERAADQHRVAHALHRVAHQRGLVVHRLEPHPGRQQRPDRVHRRLHRGLEVECVAVGLARDVDQRRGPAVARHDLEQVLRAVTHAPQVGYTHRPGAALADHDPADRVGRVGEPRDDDGVLAVVAVGAAGRLRHVRPADRLRHLVHAHAVGREACRVELHGDLPHASPLDRHLSHVGQSGQPRPHGEVGEVPEHQRVGARELVLQHRKYRRREPLGTHVQPVGQ